MPMKNKKHFDRIPDNAYYFSIDIQSKAPQRSALLKEDLIPPLVESVL